MLVSPPGALAGAVNKIQNFCKIVYSSYEFSIHSVVVLVVEETVLLIPIPSYIATTLIMQLLPGGREEKV